MVVYPDLASARIQTTVDPSFPSLSSLPPQPPPSSEVLKRAEDALYSSSMSSSWSSSIVGRYDFVVEREVLARARAREGSTAREKSIELDLTGAQVDSFDNLPPHPRRN